MILSTQFQDIKREENIKGLKEEYIELKQSLKAISKSNRIKCLLIINAFFIGMYTVYNTLRNVVLLRVGIEEKIFGVIFAIRNIYIFNMYKIF